MRPLRIIIIVVVGALFIAAGVFVAKTANWFPTQASADSASVDGLFNLMLGIATVIFLIIEGGILWSVIFFRHRKGDNTDGPNIHGNSTIEFIWTAIPAVIVIILAGLSYKVFADMQAPQANELGISVTGQQFVWTFVYPYEPFSDLNADQNAVAKANMVSSVLHLPVNRAIRMDITSVDVIHSFFIPEFRVKQDALPGSVTTARFTPTVIGTYTVECTELCGQGHANMHNLVYVESNDDYLKFVSDLRDNAKKAALNPRAASRGKQLMQQKYPCGGCHTLTDAGLTGTVGPKLDGVATRAATNQDNRLTNRGIDPNAPDAAAQYLRSAIINPSLYVIPGYSDLMPKNFGDPNVMPTDDREAIINYLLTQK